MRLCRHLFLATTALTMLGALPAQGMSLQEAAFQATATNPQIEAAKENRRAQVFELRQGRGLYFPRLDVSADVGPEWTETRAIDEKTLLRYDTQIRLTQLLFDGFDREAKIEQRAARLDGASLRVEERVETLSLDAAEVYMDVLRYQELLDIAAENIAVHEDILSRVGQRVNAGQSGVGDQQQTESRLSAARDTLVSAEQDLADARARFLTIVGSEPEALSPPPSLESALPASVNEAVVYAVNNSPTLRARAAQIDEARAAHREAGGAYYPTIELELQHKRNHNVDGVEGINNDASAMVMLSWNLFNGGIDTARRVEMSHRIGEQRAETMQVERAVAEETRLSWNALESARNRVAILRDQVASNTEVVDTYRQEFLIGQRDLLDLLDSENELFLSRSALVSAEYVTDFAVYRILAVMGALSSALGVADPEEAAADARAGAGVVPDYAFGDRTVEGVTRPAPDMQVRAPASAPAAEAVEVSHRPAPVPGTKPTSTQ